MWFNYLVDYNPIVKICQNLLKSKLFSDLTNYFSMLFCKNCPKNVQNLLFATGVFSLTFSTLAFFYKQYNLWKWIPSHFENRKTVNKEYFTKKYGEGYVVITGAADGIGAAFAQILAPMFNLILVDLNKEKLDKKVTELQYLNPQTNIIAMKGNLSNIEGIEGFVQSLKELIEKKIDINIIVNNVGMGGGSGPYFDVSPKQIALCTVCNFGCQYTINKELIPYLRKRDKRSAIINLASSTGVLFSPYLGIYSTIKHLLDIYTRTLALENSQNIDIISARPFGVTTPLMKMRKENSLITPSQCAFSILADLGKTDTTFSGFEHKLIYSIFRQKTERQVFDEFTVRFGFVEKK